VYETLAPVNLAAKDFMSKQKSQLNATLALITSIIAVGALLTAAIVTRYPGLIEGEGRVGPASGRITIDGRRSTAQPQLPEVN
jgi:hypothetical protein